MNEREKIYQDFVRFFQSEGYRFLTEGSVRLETISPGYRLLASVGSALAFGAVGTIATGYTQDPSEERLVLLLTKIATYCDLVSIKLTTGAPNLVMTVEADTLTDEALVGRCSLIHDELPSFKSLAYRLPWGKLDVMANVFLIFHQADRATHFRENLYEKCKKVQMFKKLFTVPWIVDVSNRKLTKYRGVPFGFMGGEKVEAGIFR